MKLWNQIREFTVFSIFVETTCLNKEYRGLEIFRIIYLLFVYRI